MATLAAQAGSGNANYKLEASVTKHSTEDPVTYLDRLAVVFRYEFSYIHSSQSSNMGKYFFFFIFVVVQTCDPDCGPRPGSVSYTHLTLPTIYTV